MPLWKNTVLPHVAHPCDCLQPELMRPLLRWPRLTLSINCPRLWIKSATARDFSLPGLSAPFSQPGAVAVNQGDLLFLQQIPSICHSNRNPTNTGLKANQGKTVLGCALMGSRLPDFHIVCRPQMGKLESQGLRLRMAQDTLLAAHNPEF